MSRRKLRHLLAKAAFGCTKRNDCPVLQIKADHRTNGHQTNNAKL
jgi:hypothetical protein